MKRCTRLCRAAFVTPIRPIRGERIGTDVDAAKVDALHQGKSYIKHIPAETVARWCAPARFRRPVTSAYPGSRCGHYLCPHAAQQESGAGHFVHYRHRPEHRAVSAQGDARGAGIHHLSGHYGRRPARGARDRVRPRSRPRFPPGLFARTRRFPAIPTASSACLSRQAGV